MEYLLKQIPVGLFLNKEIEIEGYLLAKVIDGKNEIVFLYEPSSCIYYAFTCNNGKILEQKQALSLKQLTYAFTQIDEMDVFEQSGFPFQRPVDISFSDITSGNFKILSCPYGEDYIYSNGEITSNEDAVNSKGHKLSLTTIELSTGKYLLLVLNHHEKSSYLNTLSSKDAIELTLRNIGIVEQS